MPEGCRPRSFRKGRGASTDLCGRSCAPSNRGLRSTDSLPGSSPPRGTSSGAPAAGRSRCPARRNAARRPSRSSRAPRRRHTRTSCATDCSASMRRTTPGSPRISTRSGTAGRTGPDACCGGSSGIVKTAARGRAGAGGMHRDASDRCDRRSTGGRIPVVAAPRSDDRAARERTRTDNRTSGNGASRAVAWGLASLDRCQAVAPGCCPSRAPLSRRDPRLLRVRRGIRRKPPDAAGARSDRRREDLAGRACDVPVAPEEISPWSATASATRRSTPSPAGRSPSRPRRRVRGTREPRGT